MSAALYGEAFFAGRSPLVQQSADAVVPVIARHLNPRTVLDVGCGKGEWMAAFEREDCETFGVDIACPDGGRFLQHDLTTPLDLGRRFDLVISLETAEHLAPSAAGTFVASLARHSDTIVFSAAVVGQEGVGHVNCRPHAYWHGVFATHGYAMEDPFRPLIAHDVRVSDWYRRNLFLYRKASA